MDGTKWILLSRGVLGPLLSLVGLWLASQGIEFGAEDQAAIVDKADVVVGAMTSIVGTIVGLWGRVSAKKTLTLMPGGGS